jgi:hypothetical protein
MKKVKKAPIDPRQIRTIPPEGFSWIDRRFVREGFIKSLEKDAAFLYFFLTTVSDAEGISFYGDRTLAKLLKLTCEDLTQARSQLIEQGLILYRYPLYQVLPLPQQLKRSPQVSATSTIPASHEAPSDNEDLMSLREFLKLTGRERPGREERGRGEKEAAPM